MISDLFYMQFDVFVDRASLYNQKSAKVSWSQEYRYQFPIIELPKQALAVIVLWF